MDVRSDSDLGSYTCTGENSVGTTTEEVAVTGEPLPAVVTSPATSHLPHSYSLHWTAGSLQPLTETRLLLREVAHIHSKQSCETNQGFQKPFFRNQAAFWPCLFTIENTAMQVGTGDWTNMIIPSLEVSRSSSLTYRMQFSLHNLLESSSYEVIIQTKNKVGWSPSSDTFVFTTSTEQWGVRGQLVFAQSASSKGSVVAVPVIFYFTVFSIIIMSGG